MKPQSTLRQLFGNPKDKDPIMDKAGVVYRINCKDCEASYVGQTGRHLKERIKEHKKLVETGNTAHSGVAEHAFEAHHEINFDNIEVIHVESNQKRRLVSEAITIQTTEPAMNRERGCELPLPFCETHQAKQRASQG